MNPIQEFLSFMGKVPHKEYHPVEDAMLHIRAKGLREQSRLNLYKTLVLGFPVTYIIGLIFLPISLFTNRIISTVISTILTILAFSLFDLTSLQLFLVALSSICLLNIKSFSDWVQCLLFDVFDLLTFGSATKTWVNVYFSQVALHQEYTKKVTSPLYSHIFTSRQLWQGNQYQKEGDYFFSEYQNLINNGSEHGVKTLVSDYWRNNSSA